MRAIFSIAALAAALAGCAIPPPAISQIDGDSVTVEGLGRYADLAGNYDLAEFDAKAAEACGIYGKAATQAISIRRLRDNDIAVLYACR